MNEKEFFDILSKNINYIIIDNGIISGGTFEIKKTKNKYSSLDEKSYRLFYNETAIATKGVLVNYNCPNCHRSYTILLKRLLTKKTHYCIYCKELDESKRKKQSDFITKSFSKYNKIKSLNPKNVSHISNIDLIKISNNEFNNEKSEFRIKYFKSHLTRNDFNKLKHHIYSINGYDYIKDFIYYDHIKTNNQMKYSSYLYDSMNDILINFNNVKYICENCDKIFKTTRKPIERINNYRCLCKDCAFSNKTFKVKSIFNIERNKITYQSYPELKLISFCNYNGIVIENGPKIPYYFKGKHRMYIVDYYIPFYKIMVEIKDNHIWHKNQIDSGQWLMKQESAKKYAKQNNLKFKLVFTQYLDDFLNTFKI